MNWYLMVGLAELALVVVLVVTYRGPRAGRDLVVQAVPMAALAVATMLGWTPALVVSAVFSVLWLANQALSWVPGRLHDRTRTRLGHALLGVVSLAVPALAWWALAGAHVGALA